MRMLTFKPASDEIYAQVYSPSLTFNELNNYEAFSMSYDMEGAMQVRLG